MDNRVVLAKIITLIYRESLLNDKQAKSIDLIKNILSIIKTDTQQAISFNGINKTKELKDFCYELLNDDVTIEKDVLIQRLKIVLENDEKLLCAILQGIEPEYDEPTNKRVIISYIKYLNNFYKEYLMTDIINKASMELKFNRNSITNINDYISNFISQLEPLYTTNTLKDPAIMNEVDLNDSNELDTVLGEIKKNVSGTVIFRTGWQALNRMLQGGFRRGEFVMIPALQHKYKTGFTLSIFAQIARYNKPNLMDPNKKPLLLRIAFEDDITANIQFLFQYLKAHEPDPSVVGDLSTLSASEISSYIKERLAATGFHIKMFRVDPTQWTYKDICNKIIELEAQGYEIQVLMLDYLALVPTTGCTIGPAGIDRRDQFRRVKNFCQARKITVITPHQLSTEAKQLIRNGVPEANFVKEVAEKGYTEGSKQLDQEVDLEIYIHLFSQNKKWYLSVQRGKHRIPTIIDTDDKYFILPFLNKDTPLLEDVDREDSSIKTPPKKLASDNIGDIIY